jgi:HD superfamily phosphohydrolase
LLDSLLKEINLSSDLKMMSNYSFSSDLSMDTDTSSSLPTTPDKDGDPASPKAKEWDRLIERSEGHGGKNMIINDAIHGHIKVPAICRIIMDTPEFVRLKHVKQLGTAYLVYPSADHSRFAHSVGVMHLAGLFIDELRNWEKPDAFDYKDKLCVMIAGLCHDLGHGPYSHLWEYFMKEARPESLWRHEESSLKMLDYLIEKNNLLPVFLEHGFDDVDLLLIKELINGGPLDRSGEFKGRGPEKRFLYQIVANKTSGIDVDKWEYFLRDSRAMNLKMRFDCKRFMMMSQLEEKDGITMLALADKEALSVKQLFADRMNLHDVGYQHHTVKKTDRMLLDVLLGADKHINLFYNQKGEVVPLSSACDDMFVFSQLSDDYLFNSILHSRIPELRPAQQIIHRISTRKLYPIVGWVRNRGTIISRNMKEHRISLIKAVEKAEGSLVPADLVLSLKRISCGQEDENPLEKVLFVDSKGRSRNYSTKYLKENMPAEKETVYVMLRKEGEGDGLRKEAKKLVWSWLQETFRDEEFDISGESEDRD